MIDANNLKSLIQVQNLRKIDKNRQKYSMNVESSFFLTTKSQISSKKTDRIFDFSEKRFLFRVHLIFIEKSRKNFNHFFAK